MLSGLLTQLLSSQPDQKVYLSPPTSIDRLVACFQAAQVYQQMLAGADVARFDGRDGEREAASNLIVRARRLANIDEPVLSVIGRALRLLKLLVRPRGAIFVPADLKFLQDLIEALDKANFRLVAGPPVLD